MADPGALAFDKTGPQLVWFSNLSNKLGLTLHAAKFLPTGFKQEIPVSKGGDAGRALEIYGGRFEFAGEVICSTPSDVFNRKGMHNAWRQTLITLDWLPDFSASGRNLHDQYALRLLQYWSLTKNLKLSAHQSVVVTCALATYGQQIARRCDKELQQNFLKVVSVHLRNLVNLKHRSAEAALEKALAISYCVAAFQGLGHLQKLADDLIERNLSQVILLDGGHRSGDIHKLLAFLKLALPLQSVNAGVELSASVTRSLALLRLLQGTDGQLSAVVCGDENVDANFAFGEQQTEALNIAAASGFARLEHGKSTLIANTSTALAIEFYVGTKALFHTTALTTGKSQPARLEIASQGQALLMKSSTASRIVFLSANGDDIRVEDRLQSGTQTEVTLLLPLNLKLLSMQEGQAIMIVMPDNTVWHLRQRGGSLHIGKTARHAQILIKLCPDNRTGGINWSLKKQLRPSKLPRNKQAPTALLI